MEKMNADTVRELALKMRASPIQGCRFAGRFAEDVAIPMGRFLETEADLRDSANVYVDFAIEIGNFIGLICDRDPRALQGMLNAVARGALTGGDGGAL